MRISCWCENFAVNPEKCENSKKMFAFQIGVEIPTPRASLEGIYAGAMKMHLALTDWYGLVVDIRLFVFWAPKFDNWWFIDYLYTFIVWLLWGMVMVSALNTWGDIKDRAHLCHSDSWYLNQTLLHSIFQGTYVVAGPKRIQNSWTPAMWGPR